MEQIIENLSLQTCRLFTNRSKKIISGTNKPVGVGNFGLSYFLPEILKTLRFSRSILSSTTSTCHCIVLQMTIFLKCLWNWGIGQVIKLTTWQLALNSAEPNSIPSTTYFPLSLPGFVASEDRVRSPKHHWLL